MTHGIESNTHAVYTKQAAWHGLGTVVEEAGTPQEFLEIAEMNWNVTQRPLEFANEEGGFTCAPSHVVNLRDDTKAILGVVGKDWRPVQNAALADLASQLNSEGTVKCESAGQLFSGKRVWFMLRGESVYVGEQKDEVKPYILLANGHDGTLALTVQTTTVRVECNNKLNIALGDNTERRVRYLHTKGVNANIDEIRTTLGLFQEAREAFAARANMLSGRVLTGDDVGDFFKYVYTKVLQLEIPTGLEAAADPNGAGRKLSNAEDRIGQWKRNFENEADARGQGSTAWAAFNAVTEEFRLREGGEAASLFGAPAQRRRDVFKAALALLS